MKPKHNQRCNIDSKSLDDDMELKGINLFKNQLEKFFFADVVIQINHSNTLASTFLDINLSCNFGLTESLFHLNSGNWGGFFNNATEPEYEGFECAVDDLQKNNTTKIVVEEIAIHFKDTSLFITKIPNQTITDQLHNILSAVSENFVHFTKGLTDMPFEIFVPVFEDTTGQVGNSSAAESKMGACYFNYWGMYYRSNGNEDSQVFDLHKKTIINGDFSFLNKGE